MPVGGCLVHSADAEELFLLEQGGQQLENPIGEPLFVKPQGMLIPGRPARLRDTV